MRLRWNKCQELGEYLKKEEKNGGKRVKMGKVGNWMVGGENPFALFILVCV